jgi:flagellar biosynthesis/type III secretory pathway protein FliH
MVNCQIRQKEKQTNNHNTTKWKVNKGKYMKSKLLIIVIILTCGTIAQTQQKEDSELTKAKQDAYYRGYQNGYAAGCKATTDAIKKAQVLQREQAKSKYGDAATSKPPSRDIRIIMPSYVNDNQSVGAYIR